MKLSEIDFYAIRSYSFAVRKTNSFFSLTTVVLSLAIIALSILINYSTISNLWLSLQELPILSSQTLAYPPPLTDTLVCFRSNSPQNGSNSIPQAKVYLRDSNFTELSIPSVPQAEVQKMKPIFSKQIGSNFGCINLQSMALTPDNHQFIIEVFSQNVTLFIPCQSITSIISNTEQQAIVLSNDQQGVYRYYLAQIVTATISDRLLVGYQPEIITTVQKSEVGNFFQISATPFTSSNMLFGLKLFFPSNYIINSPKDNYNVLTVSITRYDIGYIVGALLSWISILSLFCSIIVAPLMDKALSLVQTETIFHVKSQLRSPSVLKFIIASVKSGLFLKEDTYVKLCERLDYFKDIGLLLKAKMALKRLSPVTQRILNDEIIASEQNFNTPHNEEQGIQFFSQSKTKKTPEFIIIEDQSQQNLIIRARKAFLTWLDSGSDAISINYKGKGYGSTQSLGLTVLFFLGFLLFLSLFGVFQANTSTDIYNIANVDNLQYTFTTDEVFFATANGNFTLQLLSGNYQFKQTIPVVSNPACFLNFQAATFKALNIPSSYVFCFQNPVTIKYSSNKEEETLIYINNTYLLNDDINVFHSSLLNKIEYISPIESFFNVPPLDWNAACMNTKEVKIYKRSDDSQQKTAQFLPDSPCVYKILDPNQIVGYNIRINPEMTEVSTTTSTFFDMVQNIWGFAILCFTVLLMKATKYINLRQKERLVSTEKAEFRDSLCILLAKVNGLLAGRHKEELGRARYYVKQELRR